MDWKEFFSEHKNLLVMVVVVSFIISSIAGTFFGYYGSALLSQYSRQFIYNINGNGDNIALPNSVEDESKATIEIFKKYSPAVVSIVASKDLPVYETYYTNPWQDFCNDPFLRQFFGNCEVRVPEYRQKGTERREVGAGTGFVIRPDGLIATNKHVVNDETAEYTVIMSDEKQFTAQVLAKDPLHDLAILKIEAAGLPTIPFGNSSKVQVGETVVAIGNALGEFSNTLSKGVVSGLFRSVVAGTGNTSETLDSLIQTDTAINPGNSGGPLLNLRGEVIGINTAIAVGAENVGFAIPINSAKKAVRDVEQTGKITYPYLGVRYTANDDGALVMKGEKGEPAVIAGSPAEKAGVKEGDLIFEANGKKINKENTLAAIVQDKNVGDTLTLKIKRDGGEISVEVILEEMK